MRTLTILFQRCLALAAVAGLLLAPMAEAAPSAGGPDHWRFHAVRRQGERRAAKSGPSRKVIVRADDAADLRARAAADGVLVADYGSFALYRLPEAALARWPAAARSQLLVATADMDRLLIDAYPFDTQRDPLNLPAALTASPAGRALHLVQFVGPIKHEWLDKVEATGAELVHYIANNAYLVWADVDARQQLAAFAADKGIVQYSAPFHPYFKLGPSIRDRVMDAKTDPAEQVQVVIQMYRHAGSGATEAAVRALALEVETWFSPILVYQNAIITVRAGDLAAIAARPDVNWLGERFERERLDEVQGQILAGNLNVSGTVPTGPGYEAWLASYGFSTNPADYPVIDITDDGIGGNTSPTVPNNPTLDPTLDPRVVFRISCNSPNTNDGRGPDNHGHINASIAVGTHVTTTFPYGDENGYKRGLGINPFGRVGGTRIFGGGYNISLCGGTDAGVIAASYNAGARISSNSWGCAGCAPSYDDSSQAYDAGVRDALPGTPGNQEFITLFAAGNSGPGSATVGTPGNGKNMITVGASEGVRPTWTDGCNVNPAGADNAMDVIGFSSRGPSPGGRAKPEIIAPGTHIQGTRTTHPSPTFSSVCDPAIPLTQTVFAASSGTSHSTPAVAGVASLYYWWLQNTHTITQPTPALMKAYLIGHPRYLTGLSANDTLPSNSQGYGMPDMSVAFDNTPRQLVNQTVLLNNTGETYTLPIQNVANTSRPVRVVLAWTDAPGAIGTSPQVNNLNLEVIVNGTTYLGNRFSGQWSTTGGSADNANNYEAVFLPAGTAGQILVRVTAANIGGDGVPGTGDATDQDFALVVYNATPAGPTPLLEIGGRSVAEVSGNGDGYIDPGEAFSVNVGMSNIGTLTATVVSGTLAVTSGNASMTNGSAGYADIAPSVTITNSTPFQFQVNPLHTCGLPVSFVFTGTHSTGFPATSNFSLPTGTLVTLWQEDFDSAGPPALPAGWSSTADGGQLPWTTVTSYSVSAPNSAFAPDRNTVGNSYLYSPVFTPTSPSASLTFRNRYDLENGFDGGVLEISVNGGVYTDVLAAGGAFVSGGYNGTISSAFASPIGGRQAWTNVSNGFITSTVTMPGSAAGQAVRLRWRVATDNSVSDQGQWIDSVTLYDGYACNIYTAGLDLTKSASAATVKPSRSLTYTIVLANSTGVSTTNVILSDTLPAGTSYVSSSGGTFSGGTVTWSVGTLGANSAITHTLVISVNVGTAPGTSLDNTATASSDQIPLANSNTITAIVAPPFDLYLPLIRR